MDSPTRLPVPGDHHHHAGHGAADAFAVGASVVLIADWLTRGQRRPGMTLVALLAGCPLALVALFIEPDLLGAVLIPVAFLTPYLLLRAYERREDARALTDAVARERAYRRRYESLLGEVATPAEVARLGTLWDIHELSFADQDFADQLVTRWWSANPPKWPSAEQARQRGWLCDCGPERHRCQRARDRVNVTQVEAGVSEAQAAKQRIKDRQAATRRITFTLHRGPMADLGLLFAILTVVLTPIIALIWWTS